VEEILGIAQHYQKVESLAYIFVADSMGLLSFKFVKWALKDASFLHQSAFWPFNVIQDRWFWYQSKACMWLLISLSLWLWSYLAPFLRYSDLFVKNCLYLLPLSHSACSIPMLPLEFRGKVNRQENRVMSEDPMIVAWVVLTCYQTVTNWQTDKNPSHNFSPILDQHFYTATWLGTSYHHSWITVAILHTRHGSDLPAYH